MPEMLTNYYDAHLKTLDFLPDVLSIIYMRRNIHSLLRHFYSFKDRELLVSAQVEFQEMFSLQNRLGLVEGCLRHGEECQIPWR